MKTKAVWDLLRVEHGLMYAGGVVVGVVVSVGADFDFENMLLGVLTAMFLQASAFALNDYFDYEVDLANKRMDRPLVRGDLSKGTAFAFFLLLAPLGFAAAYLISFEALLLAFAITLLGFLYDVKLKEFGFAGNIYIAFSMAAPFIFGSVVAKNVIVPSAALLALIAFFSGVAREVMKGIEDVEGDALRNVKTIARVKGVKIAAKVSALLFILSVALSFFPLLLLDEYFMDFKYLIPVAITDTMLLYISRKLLIGVEKGDIERYRKESLVALSLGLVGFLGGAF
jgi:geranylgeranylglycerol-phosphate geranylgeranyltransferase